MNMGMAAEWAGMADTTVADAQPAPRAAQAASGYCLAEPESRCAVVFVAAPRLRLEVVVDLPHVLYRLRAPLRVDVSVLADGMLEASNARLAVYGAGRDESEALSEFCEMFDLQYRALVPCEPDSLTDEARDVRRHFEALVSEVVTK